jgi:hypothetical protein
MNDKVYTLGCISVLHPPFLDAKFPTPFARSVLPNEGEYIENTIFTSVKNAIKYMEENIIKIHVNCKYERDDSILDEGEKARWYELREISEIVYLDGYDKNKNYDHNKNFIQIVYRNKFERRGDYYRVLERQLI